MGGSGQSSRHYEGIARFYAFIAQPKIQQRWHEHTGYLPLGFKRNLCLNCPVQLTSTLLLARWIGDNFPTRQYAHRAPQHQIRGVNDEVLEAMFAGL